MTSIGHFAFEDCSNLTAITIPENSQLTSIEYGAFSGCSRFERVIINCANVGDWLSGLSSLKETVLGESVTSIGVGAFSGCSSLTSIIVATGNTIYDSRNGCNAIIETSSNTLILGCSATVIPESVTSIGESAFRGCRSLTAINIPEGVTSIASSAFSGCTSLTSITISEGVTSIGKSAFWGCSSLTAITIPESVTSIGRSAFHNCSSLTTINIPEDSKLTSIGESAFRGCRSLTAITLPKSVDYILDNAFSNCPELTDVYCYAEEVPSTKSNAFDGSYPKYATLHVPASAINSYKDTAPWSSFGTIVCLTDEDMSIEQLTNDNSQQTIYDLCGRRVTDIEKGGIYIVGGKKVIIK